MFLKLCGLNLLGHLLIFIIAMQNQNRTETGFDDYPTVDIHMYQLGLHDVWLDFLRHYVAPLNRLAYAGYDEVQFIIYNLSHLLYVDLANILAVRWSMVYSI